MAVRPVTFLGCLPLWIFILLLMPERGACQILMERANGGENYGPLANLDLLFDGDSSATSCIDFKLYWTFRPMVTIRHDWTAGNSFTVTVDMHADIAQLQGDIIRVFTSRNGVESGTEFPTHAVYDKCPASANGNDYSCTCSTGSPCSYFVQMNYDDMAQVTTSTVKLCEISAA